MNSCVQSSLYIASPAVNTNSSIENISDYAKLMDESLPFAFLIKKVLVVVQSMQRGMAQESTY